MIIRSEQMEAFESGAADEFVSKLSAHLRESYHDAVVRLPGEESEVASLSEHKLDQLVRVGIARARHYGLTFESSISAFTAVMFETAPNFDKHNLSKLCLEDKNVAPNDRLDEVLKVFTEKHWEKVRNDYDIDAWEATLEGSNESAEGDENKAMAVGAGDEFGGNSDLEETVMNTEPKEAPKTSVDADDSSPAAPAEQPLDGGVSISTPASRDRATRVDSDDLDFSETVVDISTDDDIDLDATIANID